jgi:hypothetical protein
MQQIERSQLLTTTSRRIFFMDHAGPKAKCLKWRPFRRGPLRGFSCIQFTTGLILCEIGISKAGERIWTQPPARPWVEHALVMDETIGRPKWQKLVDFSNNGVRADFSRQVIRARLAAFPNALDDEPESDSSDLLEAEEARRWFERQQGRGRT